MDTERFSDGDRVRVKDWYNIESVHKDTDSCYGITKRYIEDCRIRYDVLIVKNASNVSCRLETEDGIRISCVWLFSMLEPAEVFDDGDLPEPDDLSALFA